MFFVCYFLNRQLPAPYGKPGPNGTAIPLPATVLVTRRCPPDKVRPLPPTPSHQSKYLFRLHYIETETQHSIDSIVINKVNANFSSLDSNEMSAFSRFHSIIICYKNNSKQTAFVCYFAMSRILFLLLELLFLSFSFWVALIETFRLAVDHFIIYCAIVMLYRCS